MPLGTFLEFPVLVFNAFQGWCWNERVVCAVSGVRGRINAALGDCALCGSLGAWEGWFLIWRLCLALRDSAGQVIWNGLRVRTGIHFGTPELVLRGGALG